MTEKSEYVRNELSCTDAGDVIDAAKNLIIAGLNNDDQDSIDAGMAQWKSVWPSATVDSMAKEFIDEVESGNVE